MSSYPRHLPTLTLFNPICTVQIPVSCQTSVNTATHLPKRRSKPPNHRSPRPVVSRRRPSTVQPDAEPSVRPSVRGTRHSTNDVVRQAIIPWSRLEGSWSQIQQGHGLLARDGRVAWTCGRVRRVYVRTEGGWKDGQSGVAVLKFGKVRVRMM